MSFGRALVVALALSCVPGCTSDPEDAPDGSEQEAQGEHHALTAAYRLIRLDYNPLQADASTLLLEPREGGESQTVHVGDTLDGCEVVKMVMQIDGISAVLTIREGEEEFDIPINP